MMKKQYIEPQINLYSCFFVDILTASGMGEQEDDLGYFDRDWIIQPQIYYK